MVPGVLGHKEIELRPSSADDLKWFVAHTRPRCEKKLVGYCELEGLLSTLPCYNSVHRYRGKTVTFRKPLFPGYVFLRMVQEAKQKVVQNQYVANLLNVSDQALFATQLDDVLFALDTKLNVRLAPQIGEGQRVKVKSGPLRGFEGQVEKRYGMTTVLLRVDFIGQAAAVKLEADELEMI